MFQYEIPNNFWSYAIKHVVFLINRVPSPVIKNKTPFELLFNQKPDFSIIKVFGSLCYSSTHHPLKKFDPQYRRVISWGFKMEQRGILSWILTLEKFSCQEMSSFMKPSCLSRSPIPSLLTSPHMFLQHHPHLFPK